MSYELIASGGVLDAGQLSQWDSNFAEGQRGMLELDLRLPVSESVAKELENKLSAAGVQDVSVTTASPMLRIKFRKSFPWLAVIAATVLGMIALAILVVGWRLFREVIAVTPEPFQFPVVAAIIAGIVIFGIALARR